jgi:hypothetical protein
MLPAEQNVYVTWELGQPSLPELRVLKACVAELADMTVTQLYQRAKGKSEFHVGRFELQRAMELRRLLGERGVNSRLA